MYMQIHKIMGIYVLQHFMTQIKIGAGILYDVKSMQMLKSCFQVLKAPLLKPLRILFYHATNARSNLTMFKKKIVFFNSFLIIMYVRMFYMTYILTPVSNCKYACLCELHVLDLNRNHS